MNKIIHCNTQGKKEISEVLLTFEKKDKTGTYKERKYQYADKLTDHQKSDLEASKADIEFSIDNARTFAAVIAVFGVVLPKQISLWATGNSKPYIELVIALFLFAPSVFILLEAARKVTWLHIIKIAIAQKSKIKSTEKFAAQEEEIKSIAEVLAEIRSRSRVDLTDFGLPDSTILIQEGRNK